METVKIDLGCLLEELKALDLSSAKTEVLIEYETCLEFLKSAVQQQFAAIPDYALDVIQQCLDFEAKIRQECLVVAVLSSPICGMNYRRIRRFCLWLCAQCSC